jgi:hypothetical protein
MGRYRDCRNQGIHNIDLGAFQESGVHGKQVFRNSRGVFQRVQYAQVWHAHTTFGGDSFGVINSQYNSPRHGQLGFRFVF